MNLFEARATTGNGTGLAMVSNREKSEVYTVFAWGTWGGTSFSVQASPDNGTTWVTLEDEFGVAAALTANGYFNTRFRATQVRGVLTGGAAMSITARMF